jgi:hypothetical protein
MDEIRTNTYSLDKQYIKQAADFPVLEWFPEAGTAEHTGVAPGSFFR